MTGLVDLYVAPLAGAVPGKRRPGRPPRNRPPDVAAGAARISPVDGVWLAVDWLPDGSGVLAVGENERDPEDFWILPVPGPDGTAAGRATAPDALAAGGAPGPGVRRARARDDPGPRRPRDPAHAVAPGQRDGQARRDHRADRHPRPRRSDVAGLPRLPAAPPAPRPGGLRLPVGGLPGVDGVRPRLPPRQSRRVGPRGRPRRDRCRAGGRAPSRGRTGSSRCTAARTAAT